jgi:hypothetical protein
MTVYTLSPMLMGGEFMQDLADGFCINYGFMCAPEIGLDAEYNWWVTEDEYSIWADPDYGWVQFINVDEYVTTKSVAPVLPDSGNATSELDYLLSSLGLMVSGQYATSHSFNVQAAYDPATQDIVPDSSFDLSVNVGFTRIVNGYNVFGPGGYITATFGEGYELQHFMRGGWQDLVEPAEEATLTLPQTIQLLAAYGEEATIGGIPPIAGTLIIESTELAYYNTNGEYETDILEPIYHLSCYAASDYDTVPCDIFVPVRVSLLRGNIDEPAHGSTFEQGDTVTLAGSATGGTAPYTYVWYSSHDGMLGTGNPLMTTDLTPVYKDTTLVGNQVKLKIMDSAADSTVISIYVYIEPAYLCGDADGNDIVNISDAVYLISYIFGGGPPPDPLLAGDCDCSDIVNISDAVYLISYIFGGGPEPCAACP